MAEIAQYSVSSAGIRNYEGWTVQDIAVQPPITDDTKLEGVATAAVGLGFEDDTSVTSVSHREWGKGDEARTIFTVTVAAEAQRSTTEQLAREHNATLVRKRVVDALIATVQDRPDVLERLNSESLSDGDVRTRYLGIVGTNPIEYSAIDTIIDPINRNTAFNGIIEVPRPTA